MSVASAVMTQPAQPAMLQSAVPNDPKLRSACQQFEGQFYALMLQEMQKTVPTDPEIGDDAHEQQIFQGMMNDSIAQKMAKAGSGPGDLAGQMYRQLIQADAAERAAGSPEAAIANASRKAAQVSSQIGSSEDVHE